MHYFKPDLVGYRALFFPGSHNPVSTLQLQVLEHRTMTDLKAFQEFWSKTMDTYAGRHDHVEVAFPL